MIRLFNASSTIKKFQLGDFVYQDVPFVWYVDRDIPPAPPAEIILFYSELPARQKKHSVKYLAECFTEYELEAFRAWLWETHRAKTDASEVPLPLAEVQSNITIGFSELPIGTLKGRMPLFKRDDYDLPFKVLGRYDTEKAVRYLAMNDEMRSRGVLYLQMALKSLGLGRGTTGQRLTSTVEALYESLGLAVMDRESLSKKKEPAKGRSGEQAKRS